jgi:hypothetical protein
MGQGGKRKHKDAADYEPTVYVDPVELHLVNLFQPVSNLKDVVSIVSE